MATAAFPHYTRVEGESTRSGGVTMHAAGRTAAFCAGAVLGLFAGGAIAASVGTAVDAPPIGRGADRVRGDSYSIAYDRARYKDAYFGLPGDDPKIVCAGRTVAVYPGQDAAPFAMHLSGPPREIGAPGAGSGFEWDNLWIDWDRVPPGRRPGGVFHAYLYCAPIAFD